ncbi:Zinc finger protein 112, partial [Araneus ventricosus]
MALNKFLISSNFRPPRPPKWH